MSDNLSQEDIDRLLAGMGGADEGSDGGSGEPPSGGSLSPDEKDTLGELANISMGAAATALAEILNNKVDITTPDIIEFSNIDEILASQEDSTMVKISYLSGLDYSVIFILKNQDVAIIADLMMGGTGQIDNFEVGELQQSAVSEAMNQMMGSAATNLSSIFNQPVDISPPETTPIQAGMAPIIPDDVKEVPIIGVVFKLKIGNLVDSEMMQLMSVSSAKHQVQLFMGSVDSLLQGVPDAGAMGGADMAGMDPSRMFGGGGPGAGQQSAQMGAGPVTVQPALFSSFDNQRSMMGTENQNLELVLDVQLKLTVELGRSELPIKKVLELTRGSVIELDKVAGEPVDLLANGKLIAKGEVVVIEDNFGLRITSIISPADRLKNL